MYDRTAKLRKKVFSADILRNTILPFICCVSSMVILPGGFSPFGISSFISFSRKKALLTYAFVSAIGYLSLGLYIALPYLISLLLISILSFRRTMINSDKKYVILCIIVYFISGVLFIIYNGFNLYDLMKVILEAFIIYVLSNHYVVVNDFFSAPVLRKKIRKTELMPLALTGLVVISALSKVALPLDMKLSGIICIFIMLFISYKFNVSICATGGIVLGLAIGINNSNMLYCVASFAVSGLFSSFGKKLGKIGVILTFILSNALFTYAVNDSSEILINLYEIIIAAITLFIIPEDRLEQIKYNITNMINKEDNEIQRMSIVKNFTNNRLQKLSSAFDSISMVLSEKNKVNNNTFESNTDSMIRSVSERVCRKCKGSKRCWKNNYDETYISIKNLFFACEKRGWAEQYDIQSSFRDICFNCSQLVVEINKVYELYRMNKIWESRADENKLLISQQFSSMSRVTSNLAEELNGKYSFRRDIENAVVEELELNGIKPISITVVRENSRHTRINLSVKNDSKLSRKLLLDTCNKIMGKSMKIENSSVAMGIQKFDISEQENFNVDIGLSRIRPDKDKVCGDSYSIMRPDGEKVIVALSDGMGTGTLAARESKDTVNLLEKLLSAGIVKNSAIKLVNSVLILKSFNESFATIDMFVFDLYTGEGEFIKTGGVSSYILRKNAVTEVSSGSLPAGIISEAQSYSYKSEFRDGDIILMMSDGISDISSDDEWIKSSIKGCKNMKGKEIADCIMENACKLTRECKDDMTVIAIKINLK